MAKRLKVQKMRLSGVTVVVDISLLKTQAHFSNNVWERRTAPPEDWNKPLPDHLADAAEDSLLRDHAPINA